jgi:hypothetical protein
VFQIYEWFEGKPFFFYLIQLPTIDKNLIMGMKSEFTRGGSQAQLLTIHLMYCLT